MLMLAANDGEESGGIHPHLNLLSIVVLLLIHTILIPPPILIASNACPRPLGGPQGGNKYYKL
jgi:hypothetical protein